MKHPKLLIILSSSIFAVFAVLFLTSLFSVRDLKCEYSIYGKADFSAVESILSEYEGKSLLFIDEKEIENKINETTPYNVETVEKVFPSTVKVVLSAMQERYAVSAGDGTYYILDELFTVVDKRESIKNSADALDNILLSFIGTEPPALVLKTRIDVSDNVIFNIIDQIARSLESPRDHVLSVTFDDKGYGDYYLTVAMREGVALEIRKANLSTDGKIKATFDKYFALSDAEKLSGKVICTELDGGEIVADYE